MIPHTTIHMSEVTNVIVVVRRQTCKRFVSFDDIKHLDNLGNTSCTKPDGRGGVAFLNIVVSSSAASYYVSTTVSTYRYNLTYIR